ncbi:EamA family transporter [Thermosphaera chiliense]|uniref:EamA family transporter n=1 Tax=Thermosphaera chiliense TaxID=3402707 RepID=A0A7M1URZ9_9CREN|nr:EamA family transporter [Thermosphaera aggregans]QOR94971.1 EamA family transporter [Thermosphaera aggregans]
MRVVKHKLYVLSAAVLWSTIGVASVYSTDPALAALVRAWGAGAVSLIVFRSRSFSSIISGVFLGALFILFSLSAVSAGVGVAAFLLYTAPLWSTLGSLLYGEKPGRLDALSLVLLLLALSMIGFETCKESQGLTGFAAGLGSGISYGLYISIARNYSRRNGALNVSLGAMPYAALITTILTLVVPGFRVKTVVNYAAVAAGIYLAIFCTILPYLLLSKGLEKVKASTASLIGVLEPVLAAVWGVFFLGQIPSTNLTLAYALITFSSLMQVFFKQY